MRPISGTPFIASRGKPASISTAGITPETFGTKLRPYTSGTAATVAVSAFNVRSVHAQAVAVGQQGLGARVAVTVQRVSDARDSLTSRAPLPHRVQGGFLQGNAALGSTADDLVAEDRGVF